MLTAERMIRILAALIVILLCAVPASAQLTDDDIAALQERARNEGWTFTVGENPATKYPLEQLCGLKAPENWQEKASFDLCSPTVDLPATFDWRELGGCTPVKNQRGCGSCWAFATVGALECAIRIREDTIVNLSEQWLVSCNLSGWGCSGGWFAHNYHEWKSDACGGTGAVMEDDFPYQARDVSCNCPYPHRYLIDDWRFIGSPGSIPSVEAMKQAIIKYGPISVAVAANSAMQAYTGGVFYGCTSDDINHAVVLVGWDDNQGPNGVWFMRNSWGTSWGEDGGYMRIQYGCSSIGYGACYVDYRPIYVSPQEIIGPAPQSVDFQAEIPWVTVDSFHWDFGDSQNSNEPSPTHEYEQPGYYTVTLTIDTPEGQFNKTLPGLVSVYADTLQPSDVAGDAGQSVRVDFNVRNYIPLKEIVIPFSWAGPFNLTWDSISTAGLRTEYFERQSFLNLDVGNSRMTILLRCSDDGTAPYLESGTGSVLSAYFRIPSSAYLGTNPISIVSYAGHTPRFGASAGYYAPVAVDGSVTIQCCKGLAGNVDYDWLRIVDVGDVTALIDYLFISYMPPFCMEEANINGDPDCTVDIGDLTRLIDYLFISYTPPEPCQ